MLPLPPLPQLPLALPPLPPIHNPHADEGLKTHVEVARHCFDTASVRIGDNVTYLQRNEICRLIGQLERVLGKI